MPVDRPSGKQLVALKNQIVKGFNDGNWRELAALTDTFDMVTDHPRLLRSLGWGDPDYESNVLEMLKSIFDQDPGNLEIVVDYISKTCPEGGEFASCEDEGARRIVFSPMVFKVPKEQPDLNFMSVMMPFESSFNSVYETIKSAAALAGFECQRADDIWDDSTVIQDVFSLVYRSYVVVCDFTGKNPNVFYEAGIAHTLGKHVVPITQHSEHIPFDLRHHRFQPYLKNSEGLQKLENKLITRFEALAKKRSSAPWNQ